jgi:hypothetical protein
MKYKVTFAMNYCETTEIELDREDIQGKTEGEIEALVEELAWEQIQKYSSYDAEKIIQIECDAESKK